MFCNMKNFDGVLFMVIDEISWFRTHDDVYVGVNAHGEQVHDVRLLRDGNWKLSGGGISSTRDELMMSASVKKKMKL